MNSTKRFYQKIIEECRLVFEKKMTDYGSAWRILRLPSLTDQIFIKAQRIRSIQELKNKRIDEGEYPEFIGIINYSIIALIQIEKGVSSTPGMSKRMALDLYDKNFSIAKKLMLNKNHDYGEAWKDMRVSSLTDLILQKILRIKQIEDNQGKTIISEGIDANYLDIINYGIFSLIHLSLNKKTSSNI
tara:strand:+ start:38 stop:598 length:561 start_codon:yes stop_codon:yes gene_type:complete